MKAAWLILPLALASCSQERPGTTPPPLADACRIEGLTGLVGRPATDALNTEAQRISRATRVRVIRPGDMVTMDYSSGRLNIHLDADGKVDHFACG